MNKPKTDTAGKKKKEQRDGKSWKPYKNYERWSYQRWAWEFLRRNEKFQAACKERESEFDIAKEKEIADRYGLKNFKHYKEPFMKGLRPIFASSSISSWTYIASSKKYGSHKAKKYLSDCQVLIRFNLKFATQNDALLTKQLDKAAKRLRERVEILRKLKPVETKCSNAEEDPLLIKDKLDKRYKRNLAARQKHAEEWLGYLRAIDFRQSSAYTNREICERVYPDRYLDLLGDPKKKMSRIFGQIRKLTQSGYMKIAGFEEPRKFKSDQPDEN